jgi:hypothetical protein
MHSVELKSLKPSSPTMAGFIKNEYVLSDLMALEQALNPAVEIQLNALDRVCASARATEGEDPTHYDAVWVRDSVWVYYGLRQRAETRGQSKIVLTGLLEYFSTPAQLARLDRLIETPDLANSANGQMEVLHIRFDGRSPGFADVQVGGKDQLWNHKQNDAVALVALALGDALSRGEWTAKDISPGVWHFLLRLPTYWDRLAFENMEDAGAWEEIERINTSSVALVTSQLEVWEKLSHRGEWPELLLREASRLHLVPEKETLLNGKLPALIARGYDRLQKQIPYESPDYPETSPKCRLADAALLNLIFPCQLAGISANQKRQVLATVEELVGEMGVLRYRGDAYQSGNYWLRSQSDSEADSRTDDHSGADAFAARASRLIPDTEAQWFFDSWVSQCYGILYQQNGDEADYARQVIHFNRALCQLTGPDDIAADGNSVPEFSLPESYNTLVQNGKRAFAPSPITPLNWSKACLVLALEGLKSSLRFKTN